MIATPIAGGSFGGVGGDQLIEPGALALALAQDAAEALHVSSFLMEQYLEAADKVLDAASNTFRVRLSLPNPDNRLPAGLRCKADLPATPTAPSPAAAAAVPVARGSF